VAGRGWLLVSLHPGNRIAKAAILESTLVLLENDLVRFADTVMIARHTGRFIRRNFVGTVAFAGCYYVGCLTLGPLRSG
jgi:hypothetical protein